MDTYPIGTITMTVAASANFTVGETITGGTSNATTNVLLIELPTNYQGDLDFTSFGGIPNTAKGTTGADGDIYFSTHGEGSNDTYTVIIEAIKEY